MAHQSVVTSGYVCWLVLDGDGAPEGEHLGDMHQHRPLQRVGHLGTALAEAGGKIDLDAACGNGRVQVSSQHQTRRSGSTVKHMAGRGQDHFLAPSS